MDIVCYFTPCTGEVEPDLVLAGGAAYGASMLHTAAFNEHRVADKRCIPGSYRSQLKRQ